MYFFDQLRSFSQTEFGGTDSKITLAKWKRLLEETLDHEFWGDQILLDMVVLMRMAMQKQLPPERFSGVLNVFYALNGKYRTDQVLENALVRCRKMAAE